MTAYEYADLAASNYGISFTILSVLVALTSAYFVAAHFMGKRLNALQVTLLNTIYGIWLVGLAWVAARFLSRATEFAVLSRDMADDSAGEVFVYAPFAPALMVATTLLISYGFMWSIRNPKSD